MKAVYLIKEQQNNYFKIGVSKDVRQRIKQLQTGSAGTIQLYKEFSSEYANKIEKAFHRRYRVYNIGGEWFNLPMSAVESFLQECETFARNFQAIDEKRNPIYTEYKRRLGNYEK